MRKTPLREVFLKFAGPYVVVILLVFLIQFIFISIVMDAFEKSNMSILDTAVQNEFDEIDLSLSHAESAAQNVALNSVLQEFFTAESSENFGYEKLMEFMSALVSCSSSSPYIKDIAIQNNAADMVLDLSSAYGEAIRFYQVKLSSDLETAKRLYENSLTADGYDEGGLCIYEKGCQAVPFVLKLSAYRQINSSVAVYIDFDRLLSGVKRLTEEKGGSFFVTNKQGGVLLQNGDVNGIDETEYFNRNSLNNREKIKIAGDSYYVFTGTMARSGLRCVLFFPEKQVFGQVSFYRHISMIFNFLALLAGFWFCSWFTAKESHAYMELMNTLGIKKQKVDMHENVFKEMIPHIEKMKHESHSYLRSGGQNILRELLLGEIEQPEKIKELAETYELSLYGPNYGVLVIDCKNKRGSDEFGRNFRGFMEHEIYEIIPQCCIYFENKNNIVLLFSTDASGEAFDDYARLLVARLECDVFLKCHISATFGVGEPVSSLVELPRAYRQGSDVVSYAQLTDGNEILYSHLPLEDEGHYYPIDLERSLFEYALESDLDGVRTVLETIQAENFVNRKLCLASIKELLTELRSSVNKICRQESIEYEFHDSFGSIRHFFEYTLNFFYIICAESSKAQHTNRSLHVCHEIQACILEHYDNPDISLNWLADQFSLNPSYISAMFKKHLGFTWSFYLESVRMEKAVVFLQEEHMTVKEVAQKTGFANEGTFRRSFKRVYGVSPMEWVKSKK
ncbi:MAG: helix-turn-helix domain-containing protein [Clostridia bacterium]|nr:helix-turn-helix domain-containing protein [Clostridia bacterium]